MEKNKFLKFESDIYIKNYAYKNKNYVYKNK